MGNGEDTGTVAEMVQAPFTDDQVVELNRWQAAGFVHPFTCGGDHAEHVSLVATTDGWVCPEGCGYTQAWAHPFMADGSLPEKSPLEALMDQTTGSRFRRLT